MHGVCVEAGGQFVGGRALFVPCGSWEWDSGPQA